MRGHQGDSSWRDAGNSRGLAKRRGPDLGQPINHFARQPRDAVEGETIRNRPRLLSALPIDRRSLATEIPFVLELSLDACDVDRGIARIDDERELTIIRQCGETHVRMLQSPGSRDAFP